MDFHQKPAEIDLLLVFAAGNDTLGNLFATQVVPGTPSLSLYCGACGTTLGSQQDQDEREERIASTVCESAEEEREKSVLLACFEMITRINDWLGHIVSRIGQFLQA